MSDIHLRAMIEKAKLEFMAEAGAIALNVVRDHAPADTGGLRDAFHVEVVPMGHDVVIEVTNDSEKPQLVWITEGVHIPAMEASHGSALFNPGGGKTSVFGPVHSAGAHDIPANDFLRPALEELEPLLNRLWNDKLEKIT